MGSNAFHPWALVAIIWIAAQSQVVAQKRDNPVKDQEPEARSTASKESDASPVNADAKSSTPSKTQFLRMRGDRSQPLSLDTAVVSYQATGLGGAQVDLIGAVHIGEPSYYAQLNELFDGYDVLLYELVAPEGTQIPRGGQRERGFNPVAMLQDGAKSMLGLESQLEQIDYTKKHFVRADMTPSQIAEKMAERGDTAMTLALDTLADVIRQQNLMQRQAAEGEPQGLAALAAMDQHVSLADMLGNPLKMKRMLAQQFAQTGSLDQAMGSALNQLLIVDRNAEALKGLQKQLAAGKRKIGIFYGAAHLPDLEQHLLDDFGLRKTDQRWLTAWDLTSAKQPKLGEPAGLLLNMLKALE